MKIILSMVLLLVCIVPNAEGQYIAASAVIDKTVVGFELDALPYLTGGYYGSIWSGLDHFRLRGVVSEVNVPSFATEKNFKSKKIKAYAVIIDYFISRNFTGFWFGTGFEYWDSSIKNDTETASAEYKNTVFTIGSGYVWYFYKNFYLNPWLAGHYIISGDKEVTVGSSTFKPKEFTAEASVKFGWHF
jgi:hypothetical protein